MRLRATLLASVFAAVGLVTAASAQPAGPDEPNIQRLQQFRHSGNPVEMTTVAQNGEEAAQIAKNLERIKLPQGFKIGLYAIVPDARHMAVGPNVGAVFVGTRKSSMYVVTDRDKNRRADDVKTFAPSIGMKIPNGVCFTKDGFLYVIEQNRVLLFPAAEFFYEGSDPAVAVVVEQGKLIPASEESFNHTARVCRVGADNKLYIALGQPFNVPAPEKAELYGQQGIGGIIRMDRDGKNREVFARGIRNSVGIDFNQKNGELWFTDNQVDGMGDDIPPGELNRITGPGQHFGFPWYGGGMVRTAEYKESEPPKDATPPQVEMAAHAADLGLTFYNKAMFPEKYRGGVFDAQHGSWNRTSPVGARIMFTNLKPDGSADKTEVFAEGWLDESTGEYMGRPVDVAVLADGSLLVSDDLAGAIYRIWYQG